MLRDLVKNRKSEVRYCQTLSNGQALHIYFWREKQSVSDRIVYVWNVGIIITDTRKKANHWKNHSPKGKKEMSTGECGLEGLKKAIDIILQFRYRLRRNEYLFVGFDDEKRKSAYCWLERYGFMEFYKNGKFQAYGTFNPIYWDWVATE
jgi:hypothetical protein